MNQSPILIVGKYGKTGQRVNNSLQTLGYPTRAVSRSTHPSFDWEDKSTWVSALEGTRSAYVTYQPDLAVPNAQADIKKFVEIASEVGIEHIVLLSGRGEQGAQCAEDILKNSGIAWNIVRSSWFSQNFSESFMLEGIISGELILPANEIPEPLIDVDDIAEVAVAALTKNHLRNQLFEVTGPRAMTFSQCLQEISEAIGRPLKFTSVPIDAYLSERDNQGAPRDMQWLMNELFTKVMDGRNTQVMPGVEQALGRGATDFKTYIQKAQGSGIWNTDVQVRSA